MVKITYLTKATEEEKKQEKLEEQLARECFVGKKVNLNSFGGISIYDKGKNLAYKYPGLEMDVYDENVLFQAETFAERYEKQFNCQREFVINTNY